MSVQGWCFSAGSVLRCWVDPQGKETISWRTIACIQCQSFGVMSVLKCGNNSQEQGQRLSGGSILACRVDVWVYANMQGQFSGAGSILKCSKQHGCWHSSLFI